MLAKTFCLGGHLLFSKLLSSFLSEGSWSYFSFALLKRSNGMRVKVLLGHFAARQTDFAFDICRSLLRRHIENLFICQVIVNHLFY